MNGLEFGSRGALEELQLERLNALLHAARDNAFWAPRLRAAGLAEAESLAEFKERMPLLEKRELAADQGARPPFGTNLTFAPSTYVRAHQTSSTSGAAPLRWLDTEPDWSNMVDRWVEVLEAGDVTADDRVFCAFSFGPFIGFWLAFEAAQRMGALALSGGAMDSRARLAAMASLDVTVLCCTPTYALHLAEVARAHELEVPSLRTLLVAGEPGGSLPTVKARLEAAWNARVLDHHGMTEVGPVTFQRAAEPDVLHVMETAFLAEIVDRESGASLDLETGATGELVLTTLARVGAPVLRYRTGDLVRADGFGPPPRPYLRLAGGILARTDQMVVVRGVNVYPSALDDLLRQVDGLVEYRVEVDRTRSMVDLRLTVEPEERADAAALCARIERHLRETWSLRVPVRAAAPGELPRFELKARRWVEVTA